MFTWICPKCGGEVPPSHDDCPRCVAAAAAAAAPVATTELPAPAESAPPASNQPVTAVPLFGAPERSSAPAHRRKQLPPLLVAVLSGAAILAVLAILYIYVLPRTREAGGAPRASGNAGGTRLETVAGVTAGGSGHPMAKYIEVSGIRIRGEQDGRTRIQMLVINHSNADLPAMSMDAALFAGEREVFEFPVKLPSMGPYESREVSTVMKTDVKPYELPDWQQIRPRFTLAEQR